MKIGFIGCGGMGNTHNKCLKLLSESHPVKVTAIADVREEYLKKASSLWPDAKKYSDRIIGLNQGKKVFDGKIDIFTDKIMEKVYSGDYEIL